MTPSVPFPDPNRRRAVLGLGLLGAGLIGSGPGRAAAPGSNGARAVPAQFGLKGDGSDETASLQAMADWLAATGGTASLTRGAVYRHRDAIVFRGAGWTLQGSRAVIRAVDGAPVVWTSAGLRFDHARRFVVRDLTYDGARARRARAGQIPVHGFWIGDGCADFLFERCLARDACVDGWYVDQAGQGDPDLYPRNGRFVDCGAENASRNAMTLCVGRNLAVLGGRYAGSNGLAPEAGIDVEADPGATGPSHRGLRIENVRLAGNRGPAINVVGVGDPDGIDIRNVAVTGHAGGAQSRALEISGGVVRVSGFAASGFSGGARPVVQIGSGEVTLNRLAVSDVARTGPVLYANVFLGKVGVLRFDRCRASALAYFDRSRGMDLVRLDAFDCVATDPRLALFVSGRNGTLGQLAFTRCVGPHVLSQGVDNRYDLITVTDPTLSAGQTLVAPGGGDAVARVRVTGAVRRAPDSAVVGGRAFGASVGEVVAPGFPEGWRVRLMGVRR